MSEEVNVGSVAEDVDQSLLIDEKDLQTKVVHVDKYSPGENKNDLEENILLDDLINYKKEKKTNEFIGLTKEELKLYINDPKWKRIRWIIAILYIILLVLLLIGSILLIIYCQGCPPKPKLVWYEKDIIYEIDVTKFLDTNQDGIGDIKGIEEKLSYLQINNIKSIILESSIFNATGETSIKLDGKIPYYKKIDLLTIDSSVGTDNHLQDLLKILNRKDMHLIIDLPLSSTDDPHGYSWYGSSQPLSTKINNPCNENNSNLGCHYYKFYGRLPLNFNHNEISNTAESRLRYWLETKKMDGIRVNLPLQFNNSSYEISYKTIEKWISIKNHIEKKTKPKLLLIDIPFGLENIIDKNYFYNITTHSLLLQKSLINVKTLYQRIKSFQTNRLFWKLGSKRRSDDIAIINQNQLSKEMILTITLLIGGTPILLYGEEIGLDQKSNPLMAWTSDRLTGGFSSCISSNCSSILLSYKIDPSKTNVKLQEALGGQSKDSLLILFRHLSKLRQSESFQFGLLETGYQEESNIYWFIREAVGHRGYIIILNLNKNANEIAHISLHQLTKHHVPLNIHYEYQWPNIYLPTSNKTHFYSDNLLIHSQSINIFWWKPKIILRKNAKEHEHI